MSISESGRRRSNLCTSRRKKYKKLLRRHVEELSILQRLHYASNRNICDRSDRFHPSCFSWPENSRAEIMVPGMDGWGCAYGSFRGFLSDAWGLNKTILGALVLAVFTGIPDVVTATRMALDGRGTAVMSEALNSNNLNILFGICVPATVFGIGTLAGQTVFSVWWLLVITVANLFLLYFMKGFTRMSGALSVGLYVVFASVVIGWKLF